MRATLRIPYLMLAALLVVLSAAGCKHEARGAKGALAAAGTYWQPVALEGPAETYASPRGQGATAEVTKDRVVVEAISTSKPGVHSAGVKLPFPGNHAFQLQLRFVHPESISGLSVIATDTKDQELCSWTTTSFGDVPAGVLVAWNFDPGAAAPGFFTFKRMGNGEMTHLHVLADLTGEQKPAGFAVVKLLVSTAQPSSEAQRRAGPAPVIVSFGPNTTRKGEIFNASGGQASLWVTCKSATKDVDVTWNEKSLPTVFGNAELVTAVVPTEFYVQPGKYAIALRNRVTGQVSNSVVFTVTE